MTSRKEKKSITFISPFGLPLLLDPPGTGAGGAERQFFLFGRGLSTKGWSVSYLTDKFPSGSERKTVMPVVVASFSFMGGSKLNIPFDWVSLLVAMWKANSYYYVIKTPAYLLVPMYIFTKIFKKKLVFWAQTDFDAYPEMRIKGGFSGVLMNIGIKRADIILAQSERQVTGFKKNFNKDASLIKSISGELSIDALAQKSNKCVDVLWVGNSMANKRYEIILSLAKILPEFTFALAMINADQARYTKASEESKKLDNVEFLGEVNPVQMESWYGHAKLLLNTSVREGFPNTFIQAWQHGVPVVSLCIDPDGILEKHEIGIVIDYDSIGQANNDIEEYANKLSPVLKLLLTDNKLYQKLSENSQTYANENHSECKLVERLEQILDME